MRKPPEATPPPVQEELRHLKAEKAQKDCEEDMTAAAPVVKGIFEDPTDVVKTVENQKEPVKSCVTASANAASMPSSSVRARALSAPVRMLS